MSSPQLSKTRKYRIYALWVVLALLIYTLNDLYVPIKHYFAGNPMTWEQIQAQSEWRRYLPFALVAGVLLGMRRIEKVEAKMLQQAQKKEVEGQIVFQ